MHYESKEVGLSRSVSSSSREIKNQATILLLCVMTSNYQVDSAKREEYFMNLCVTDETKVMVDFSQVSKQYTCFTFLLCILSGVSFPGSLFWLHTIHHSKRLWATCPGIECRQFQLCSTQIEGAMDKFQ